MATPATASVLPDLSTAELNWLEDIFQYHAPTEATIPKYVALRQAARQFAAVILTHCPKSADRSDALRKVREAVMIANAAVALGGRG